MLASPAWRDHSLEGAHPDHAIELGGENESPPPLTPEAVARKIAKDPTSPQYERYSKEFAKETSEDELQNMSPKVFSKHFPQERTNGASHISATGRKSTRETKRDFKPQNLDFLREPSRDYDNEEEIDDSDELADDPAPSRKRIAQATQLAEKLQRNSWPLEFARSPEVEAHEPLLFLTRQNADDPVFVVQKLEADNKVRVVGTVDLRKTNVAKSDMDRRLRLEGGVSHGLAYQWDLKFEDPEHLKVFCTVFVVHQCRMRKIIEKTRYVKTPFVKESLTLSKGMDGGRLPKAVGFRERPSFYGI
jgi:hypothetical protein